MNAHRTAFSWQSKLFAAVLSLLFIAGCGGGGGGGSDAPPPVETGSVEVTVVDEFDAPVDDVGVTVTSGGTNRTGTTDDTGITTVDSVPVGSATIATSAVGFVDGSGSATVTVNAQSDVSITLERQTEPAAGLFESELTGALSSTDGQTLTIQLEVLVVNNDPAAVSAIETLTAADFTLLPCADNDPNEVECLRGSSSQPDIGYSVVSAGAENFQFVPGQAANSYAATLIIDQSGSIENTDPSDARLFATKVFLNNLGASDFASVSAFAQTQATAEPALIPDEPVTRITDFIQSSGAAATFADIDELAQQIGGDTPLFAALDQELDFTAANAPADPDRRKAVVLFTDGDDSVCSSITTPPCGLEVSVQKSVDLDVDIFTVGLGPDIDVDVLRGLAEGGRGFYLSAENAEQLFPIYRSLGELLSRTLATYRMEWTITADQAATYVDGQTVLGILQIDTGSNVLDLPLRVFLRD